MFQRNKVSLPEYNWSIVKTLKVHSMTFMLQFLVTLPSILVIINFCKQLNGEEAGRHILDLVFAMLFGAASIAWGIIWWSVIAHQLPWHKSALFHYWTMPLLAITIAAVIFMAEIKESFAFLTQISAFAMLMFGVNIFFDFATAYEDYKTACKNGLRSHNFYDFCNLPKSTS